MSEISSIYNDDSIVTLEGLEHIRHRLSMYIGRRGDGSEPIDGIYILLKEVIDNSIDEFTMGFGKNINITIEDGTVTVRDFGRGIPLGSVEVASSKMNTGGKFDDKVFKKSVGLNGVGIKAVNALSKMFYVQSFREGESVAITYSCGKKIDELKCSTKEKNGTLIRFTPDETIFELYKYNLEFVDTLVHNYAYLNVGLILNFNGKEFLSKNGLLDLLNDSINEESLYPPIHLKGDDIEIVMTHGSNYGENLYSFVNGQNTILGGTHLSAYKESIAKTLREFFKKDLSSADVRQSIVGAISIKVQEPEFEAQTKVQLGSKYLYKDGPTISKFVGDFMKTELDNYLHKNLDVADIILKKIQESERERKAISGIRKDAKDRIKKASLHNKKLRDCRVHLGDKDSRALETTIFITEGDSASGSITKSRDANIQAVFSLKGKPLNCYKMTKKEVYENEELYLLQAALNVEDGIENLRYNNIVIATDADVDGMHIRLLLLTFFLQFYPDLIRTGHINILQTPLFRVKDKKNNVYCYSTDEKNKVVNKIGTGSEITRFKGLGEISPDEFIYFIGKDIRLDNVRLSKDEAISELIEFYMGKNTPERQKFIRNNLRSNIDNVEEVK
ncbi:MAG: toprim domain-containing protein [Bacteroidales bacterium]|nr:toprim domain-containing protein [Bacteroidales bacterium]